MRRWLASVGRNVVKGWRYAIAGHGPRWEEYSRDNTDRLDAEGW